MYLLPNNITFTDNSMADINVHFVSVYGHNLEKDIKGDTSGHFKRLCVSLSMVRYTNKIIVYY